tara:strand:+ start:196 stop:474 length:279 start_codon:yes stop_codon:yes gene_type:complete
MVPEPLEPANGIVENTAVQREVVNLLHQRNEWLDLLHRRQERGDAIASIPNATLPPAFRERLARRASDDNGTTLPFLAGRNRRLFCRMVLRG